jgi:LacI family transcriptional regulator
MKSLQLEISRVARVSQSTVSRALRNHPALPRATCERIQAVARRLGYVENPLLSAVLGSVRRGRRQSYFGTLGFLTAHQTANGWKEIATYRDFYQGAKERAEQQGFKLEPHWAADPSLTGRRLSEILTSRGIIGLLLGSRSPDARFAELDWSRFAVVRLGLSASNQRFQCVVNHQIHTVRLVAAELAARGYRRIGLAVSGWQNESVEQNWLAGFLAWQHALPAKERVPVHLPEQLERTGFLEWYRRHKPDACIAVNSMVRDWLEGDGVAIPGKAGFALLDWHEEHKGLAGADQGNKLVGAAAVDVAAGLLHRNERGAPEQPRITLIRSSWHEGDTVRPRPGPA